MPKTLMPKYIVRTGFNTHAPGGQRAANGRPVEVRFEIGDEITEQSVTPKAIETLLSAGAIELVDPPPTVEVAPVVDAPLAVEAEPSSAFKPKK